MERTSRDRGRAPSPPTSRTASGPAPRTAGLRRRLAELRGASAPRPLDARALAALAANPGCRRRALLDGAGVDKTAVAAALGSPAAFGQSQFAFARGNAFEARVQSDGGAELLRLLCERMGGTPPPPAEVAAPELAAAGPSGRAERTRLALMEAASGAGWTLLVHPMLVLDVAGPPAHLEPDAVVVRPDGSAVVVEIKSFPILDGAADAAKVGAAARQAAVYVLALEAAAAGLPVAERILLVCPKDFSNLPAAEAVDVRPQLAVTRRQLARLTRLDAIAAELPEGLTFDPDQPAADLTEAVAAVPAAYAPECLSTCELAFHCRGQARAAGDVAALGRGVRGDLGTLTTVPAVLAAAREDAGSPADPAVAALRRAAALRDEAMAAARDAVAPVPEARAAPLRLVPAPAARTGRSTPGPAARAEPAGASRDGTAADRRRGGRG